VPDLIDSKENEILVAKMVNDSVNRLLNYPVSSVVMACNTLHNLVPFFDERIQSRMSSLITIVTNQVKKKQLLKVGLVGSPTTLQSGMYQNSLSQVGIQCESPDESSFSIIERVIRGVISGQALSQDLIEQYVDILNKIKEKGAETIILGCTELPLATNYSERDIQVIDSVRELANFIVTESLLKNTIE